MVENYYIIKQLYTQTNIFHLLRSRFFYSVCTAASRSVISNYTSMYVLQCFGKMAGGRPWTRNAPLTTERDNFANSNIGQCQSDT